MRPNDQATTKLIAQLDADSFAARQEAEAALKRLGEAAVPAMRTALAKPRSVEQARRLEQLVQASVLQR